MKRLRKKPVLSNTPAKPLVVHLTNVHRSRDVRIFSRECKSLADAGYSVVLIAPNEQRETQDGVTIIPVRRQTKRPLRMTAGAAHVFFKALFLDAEIYHFHDPELFWVGLGLKWLTSARLVYDVHENHPEKVMGKEWLPKPARKSISRMVEVMESFLGKSADGVATATDSIAHRFPAQKTVLVRNFPALKHFSDKACNQETANTFRLIYTGGWTRHRGILQIIQALGHVKTPGVRLTVLGRIIHKDVYEKACVLPGFSLVDYSGQVSHQTVCSLLAQSDAGLVCNQKVFGYDKSMPNKLFEYMGAGLAVIASDFDTWRPIVTQGPCGILIDQKNPKSIAAAIDQLAASPELRQTMGKNAANIAKKRYSWEEESKNLIGLYEKILK